MRVHISFAAVILLAGPVYSATIHVPGDRPTIQAAVDIAGHGDTIMVAAGQYQENISFRGFDVKVISAAGPEATVISPANTDSVVVKFSSAESRQAMLSGFTIRGATGRYCVRVEASSPTLCNNVLVDNFVGDPNYGSVFYCANLAEPLVHRNVFHDNGGAFSAYIRSPAVFRNNVIANAYVTGIHVSSSEASITNNIIISCGSAGLHLLFAYDPFDADYNLVHDNGVNYLNLIPPLHDIDADPMFIEGTFLLQAGSPCIDAGDPDRVLADPDGSRCDIGAQPFSHFAPAGLSIRVSPELETWYATTPDPVIGWTYYDSPVSSQSGFHVQVGADGDWAEIEFWDSGPVMSGSTWIAYDGATLNDRTEYYVRVKVFDGVEWGPWNERWFITHIDRKVQVPDDHPTIQEAIDSALPGDTVVLECGTYHERDIHLKSQVVLRSASGDPECATIDADTLDRIFWYEVVNSTTRVEGLTLTGGYAHQWVDLQWKGNVVYAVLSHVVFDDCVFRDNVGALLGGVCYLVASELSASSCLFEHNRATSGGVIYSRNLEPIRLTECQFVNNTASNFGGAIACFESRAVGIDGCEFLENSADEGGALYLTECDSVVLDGVRFSSNSSEQGAGIRCVNVRLKAENCQFEYNRAAYGGGGIRADRSDLTLTGSAFLADTAGTGGGGAFVTDSSVGRFYNCDFAMNYTNASAGAVGCDRSSVELWNCRFDSNAARLYGGGLTVNVAAVGVARDCSFESNSAMVGGGVYVGSSETTITDAVFVANHADVGGGLVAADATVDISGSVFLDNASDRGGAIAGSKWNGRIENCTMAQNTGSDTAGSIHIYNGSQVTMDKSIVAFAPVGGSISCDGLSAISLHCTDIYGNEGGDWVDCVAEQASLNMNLWANPQFCDLASGDAQISVTSPCAPQSSGCGQLIGALDVGCTQTDVGDSDHAEGLPVQFALLQNYPNPFNPITWISFNLPSASHVRLTVFNILGQTVAVLKNEHMVVGYHAVVWGGSDMASGVYLYRLEAGDFVETKKMVLVK